MKISKLIAAKDTMLPLCQERVSPKLAYKFMKFLSKIETEEQFYNTKMREIIETYGERDDKGGFVFVGEGIKIVKDKIDECNKKIEDLSETEVDAPDIYFSIDELSEVKMSAKEILALSDFIKED